MNKVSICICSSDQQYSERFEMRINDRQRFRLFAIVAVLWFGVLVPAVSLVFAQDPEDDSRNQTTSRLIISSTDNRSAPAIVLRAFGVDPQGNPLDLTGDAVVVYHDGKKVTDVETIGGYKVGTFTIIVIDSPPGVASQMEAIQEAIRQYASPPDMEEQIDSLAIYQVGETEAFQLLPPTNFYNAIRNFFDTPLALQSGPTALVDSLVTLLDNIDSLKPQSDMATSLVVLTDGTDVVSTKFNQEDVGRRAAELGVPIHTIWLKNENMLPANREPGRDYLA
jgi:hypothetical protein